MSITNIDRITREFDQSEDNCIYQAPANREAYYRLQMYRVLQEAHKDGRKSKTEFVWVTVNPKDEFVKPFIDAIARYKVLKIHQANIYVIEQRGEKEGDYHGVHFHMLSHRKTTPYIFERETHRIFDSLVGIPSKHIVIQYIERSQCKAKYDYMCGNKKEDKKLKVDNDEKMRRSFGLERIYSNGANFITC